MLRLSDMHAMTNIVSMHVARRPPSFFKSLDEILLVFRWYHTIKFREQVR